MISPERLRTIAAQLVSYAGLSDYSEDSNDLIVMSEDIRAAADEWENALTPDATEEEA